MPNELEPILDQTILLNKLSYFVRLEYDKHHVEYETEKKHHINDPAIIHRLEEQHRTLIEQARELITWLNEEGCCHGFSVCRGAFNYAGFLAWWDNALVILANWDVNSASLDQTIKVPGERENKPANEPKTLGYLFQRILNYIVTAQTIPPSKKTESIFLFMPKGITQNNSLRPKKNIINALENKQIVLKKQSYLELATDQGIKPIQQSNIIGGDLSPDQINSIFSDKKIFDHSIILVHNIGHTIQVNLNKKKLTVYDPNYNHREEKTLQKTQSKKKSVEEILTILGSSICIQMAFFTKGTTIPAIQWNYIDLLQKEGFHVICRFMPKATVMSLIEETKKSPAYFESLVNSLARRDHENWTGLDLLIHLHPALLPDFYKLSQFFMNSPHNKKLRALIRDALIQKNLDDITGFEKLLSAPDILLSIIALINSSKEGGKLCLTFAKALLEETSEEHHYETGLNVMAFRAPAALNQLLLHFSRVQNRYLKNKFATLLASALCLKNNELESGLSFLIKYTPENLLKTIEFSLKGLDSLYDVLDALLSDPVPAWVQIEDNCDNVNDIFNAVSVGMIGKSYSEEKEIISFPNMLAHLILQKATNESFVIHNIIENAPLMLPSVISVILQAEEGFDRLIDAFALKDKNNKTAWQKISMKDPYLQQDILDLLEKHLQEMGDAALKDFHKKILRMKIYKRNGSFFSQTSAMDIRYALLSLMQEIQQQRQEFFPIKRKKPGFHL
ncbi:MAG: hypothetical protein ACD_60C00118G0006 [uncultured bacterium]|nr:MAG: hypothetical protein ACD_60C00118G0006 [uncultured bacterium]